MNKTQILERFKKTLDAIKAKGGNCGEVAGHLKALEIAMTEMRQLSANLKSQLEQAETQLNSSHDALRELKEQVSKLSLELEKEKQKNKNAIFLAKEAEKKMTALEEKSRLTYDYDKINWDFLEGVIAKWPPDHKDDLFLSVRKRLVRLAKVMENDRFLKWAESLDQASLLATLNFSFRETNFLNIIAKGYLTTCRVTTDKHTFLEVKTSLAAFMDACGPCPLASQAG